MQPLHLYLSNLTSLYFQKHSAQLNSSIYHTNTQHLPHQALSVSISQTEQSYTSPLQFIPTLLTHLPLPDSSTLYQIM